MEKYFLISLSLLLLLLLVLLLMLCADASNIGLHCGLKLRLLQQLVLVAIWVATNDRIGSSACILVCLSQQWCLCLLSVGMPASLVLSLNFC